MPRIKDVYPSRFLKAADLDSSTRSQIREVTTEPFGDKKELKLIAAVAGQSKPMVLNVTSARFLEELTGSDDSDDWVGQDVMLVPTKVSMNGKIVDSIRLERVPRAKKAKAVGDAAADNQARSTVASAQTTGKADDPLADDSIPF